MKRRAVLFPIEIRFLHHHGKPRAPVCFGREVLPDAAVPIRGTPGRWALCEGILHFQAELPLFFNKIEGIDVHRRPDVVALEAQDELKDRAVGRRTDGAVCCMQLCPGIELLLIVEEDPAVLHAWPIHVLIVGRKRDLLPLTDGDIGKLIPGRDAELPREIVDAVDRSSSAIPQDEQTSVGEQFLKIAFPARLSVFIFQKG